MLNDHFRFRQAETAGDIRKLKAHFSEVYFDGVGTFIESLFHYFPRMKNEYGFIAEERETEKIVAAFLLMPWTWEMEGIQLNIAQMAGAATLKAYRRRGLVRELIKLFDQTFAQGNFDLAVINGIRGFYRQFGFCFAIPVENHINLPLESIPDSLQTVDYTFRLADEPDIPYLMQEDKAHRDSYSIAIFRDETAWEFLLDERHYSIFGSEFWLMEHKDSGDKFYCRIPLLSHVGGHGLLVSEISEDIPNEAMSAFFAFWKQKAIEGEKPFIRLNLHDESPVGKKAVTLGAETIRQSAWQIRMPDPARFLTKISPVLAKRIQESAFCNFTGTLRLNFFKTNLDLLWEEGKLTAVKPGEGWLKDQFRIHADLFPILCLGHRSWSELAHIQPDIGPRTRESKLLIETLFPVRRSWLYEPA